MFVVMAIKTEQFPVAAIGRVVIVIVVAMMHGELLQILTRKLALAAPADPRIQLERLLAIGKLALIAITLRTGHDLVQAVVTGFGFLGHVRVCLLAEPIWVGLL